MPKTSIYTHKIAKEQKHDNFKKRNYTSSIQVFYNSDNFIIKMILEF